MCLLLLNKYVNYSAAWKYVYSFARYYIWHGHHNAVYSIAGRISDRVGRGLETKKAHNNDEVIWFFSLFLSSFCLLSPVKKHKDTHLIILNRLAINNVMYNTPLIIEITSKCLSSSRPTADWPLCFPFYRGAPGGDAAWRRPSTTPSSSSHRRISLLHCYCPR